VSEPDFRRRFMTLATGWHGHGGHTVNRRLSQALADIGHLVTARVAIPVEAQPHPRLTVQGLDPIAGVGDRERLARDDRLPREVDTLVGHGRFTGVPALELRDRYYPRAQFVHVAHALTDELDRWRGDPDQATRHARTERMLVARADLAVGVGPLLTDEVERLAQMAGSGTPTHEMIPGVELGAPPAWRDQQLRTNLLLLGRVDDPLKGADIAAHAARILSDRGHRVQLTLLGADPANLARQERELVKQTGFQAKVKPFTTDAAEMAAELRGADVVLMPSRNEAFGLVAFEAAGHGIPILVGSNTGAGVFLEQRVPDHLGKPSVVEMPRGLERDLPERWANNVERVIDDLPASRARAMELREHLGERYTWNDAAQRLADRVEDLPRREPGSVELARAAESLNRANEATAERQHRQAEPARSPEPQRTPEPSPER
jgi:glycosyltransferase involved in cell wall biosynthesis